MRKKNRKCGLFMVLAGCVLAMAMLLLGALSGLAASENTQDVLDQLTYLQRVHIQPEWLPDIRANERVVQALLDGYQALTPEERRELTEENRADLRAYFEALYEVQGKDVAEVSGLFEEVASSSSPVSASSLAPEESSQEAGSSMPQQASQPASSAALAPAPVSETSGGSSVSLPAASQPAQALDDSGLGGRTLGAALLMVLLVVAVVLFVRFLVAVRRAGKEGAAQAHVDARAQEMFGESYDPVDDPMDKDFIVPPPADFLDTAPAPLPKEDLPFDDELEPEKDKAGFAMFAPDNTPDGGKREGLFARRKREEEGQEPEEPCEEEKEESKKEGAPQETSAASPFAPPGGPSRFDKAFGGKGLPPLAKEEKPLPKEAEPLFTANPDRRNAITTRSFSAPPRTGRPGKMPFRQGDPDDIDAIDE